jgi:ankyrin repeat protein
MEELQNESIEEEETIINNEFTESNFIKEEDYDTKQKIISFITEFMALSLKDKTSNYLNNKKIRAIENPLTSDTLIHYLCMNDDNYPLIKLIGPKSTEKEKKNKLGQTLLHVAVKNKSYKIVKYLIENGSNIQSKDIKNNSILHTAVMGGDLNIIQLILKKNPNINITNNNKETPFDIAKKMKRKDLYNYLKNYIEKNCNKKYKNNIEFNNLIKNENIFKGKKHEKNNKSILNNISMNNCSLDTKNETDSQSFNIYKKKIITKKSNVFGVKKIKPNKTINLNISFNNNNTPSKKNSYNSMNKLSPMFKTRLVYRKTTPKVIEKQCTLIEFENDSETYDYNPESKGKYFSPKISKINSNKSIFNNKYESLNDIIDVEKQITDRNHKNKIKYKYKNNNIAPISLHIGSYSPKYKIREVKKTIIHKSPFNSFRSEENQDDICVKKLLQFLKEIGMQNYGNLLISEGFDDISLIIKQMKEGYPILDDTLKEIGIIQPGDRAKILIRLQEVSNGFNFDFPFEQVYFKNNGSILKWLEKEGLSRYNKNFLDAGYQSLELLLVQMVSKYKIDDSILQNDFFIFNDKARKKIKASLETNSIKYVNELSKKKNVQRSYSKMVKDDSGSICIII